MKETEWTIQARLSALDNGNYVASIPAWNWASEAKDAEEMEWLILQEAHRRKKSGLDVFTEPEKT